MEESCRSPWLGETRGKLSVNSSTNDGFFEEAQYRYQSNASNPACIQATIFWQHGTYSLNNNGSLSLFPFPSDGRIQVQDPCAATTNIITYYNQQVSSRGPVVDRVKPKLTVRSGPIRGLGNHHRRANTELRVAPEPFRWSQDAIRG